jgi:hypothetical protein
MLLRISLIVAIIAGLAVGALNFVKVKEIIVQTRTERDNEKTQKETAQRELASTKNELQKTTTELTQTKDSLASATAAKEKAEKTADEQSKRASELSDQLATTKQSLADVQAQLAAYVATGFSPEQVLVLGKTLKRAQDDVAGAQDENRVLSRKIEKLEHALAKYNPEGAPPVPLPATLKGEIVVSDPKWNFVVLNVGEDQGVKQDGELLVNRNGQLVAKVRVTSVQKDRCIANVLPGWKITEVLEGDQVIPAFPQS